MWPTCRTAGACRPHTCPYGRWRAAGSTPFTSPQVRQAGGVEREERCIGTRRKRVQKTTCLRQCMGTAGERHKLTPAQAPVTSSLGYAGHSVSPCSCCFPTAHADDRGVEKENTTLAHLPRVGLRSCAATRACPCPRLVVLLYTTMRVASVCNPNSVVRPTGGVVLAAGRGSRGQLGLGPHVVEAQQPVPLHLQLQVSSVQPSSATLQGAAAAEAAPLHVTSVAAGTWHTLVAVTVADGGRLGCGESTGSGGSSSSINKVGLQDGSAIATGGGNLDSRWSGAAAAEAHPAASPASPVGPMVGGGQQADGKLRVPSGSPQVCRRGSGRVVVLGCGSNRWHQLGQVGEREGQPDAKFDVATANVGAGEGAGPRPGPGRGAGHGGKSLWSLKEVPLEGSAAEAAAPATVRFRRSSNVLD